MSFDIDFNELNKLASQGKFTEEDLLRLCNKDVPIGLDKNGQFFIEPNDKHYGEDDSIVLNASQVIQMLKKGDLIIVPRKKK